MILVHVNLDGGFRNITINPCDGSLSSGSKKPSGELATSDDQLLMPTSKALATGTRQ